jgi:hypothetical protein
MHLVPVLDEPQREQLLGLLEEGFASHAIDWRSAFAAPQGRSGHGMLLMIEGRPEGGILVFEKTETLRGRPRRIVNLSSWYIRPPFRRLAVRMMRALTSDAEALYTIFTPIPSVQKICERVGFRYVSRGSIVSAPLINGAGLGSGFAIAPLVPSALSNPDHARWLSDHGDPRHIGVTIRRGSEVSAVLWQRGLKLRGLPAARLIFAADHDMLLAALGAMHWHMLRHHGIVGLYLPRAEPYARLRSMRRAGRGPSVIVKGDADDAEINLLYSEQLFLRPRA